MAPAARIRRRGRAWEALAAAALANAALVLVLDLVLVDSDRPDRLPRSAATAIDPPPDLPAGTAPTVASAVRLIGAPPPSILLDSILGAGDVASWDDAAEVRPRSVDLPGDRAADRGGGAEGGTAAWTERRDRADDAALRQRIWTSPDAYRTPRTEGPRRAASPEAVTRQEQATYGDRAPQERATDGALAPSRGDLTGQGGPGLPVMAAVTEPDVTAGAPGATVPRRIDGAPLPTDEAAYVDRGVRAVDVTRKGATRDDRAVAGASNQRRVDPFDLTPPRSGGEHDGEGVAGAAAPGMVVDGWGKGGTAAARADRPVGDGDASTFATRQDPYFVELFRRLDRNITYPRELAIGLVSGRVVAIITLRADGSTSSIAIHAGSGHAAFDDELSGALRRIGKLPAVPAALLEGRGQLRVMIPYTFRSPMIH